MMVQYLVRKMNHLAQNDTFSPGSIDELLGKDDGVALGSDDNLLGIDDGILFSSKN